MTTTVQQAVIKYKAREWLPIRVHKRDIESGGKWEGKEPVGNAWQNTKPSVADWKPDENVGVMLGPKSYNLADIDLDDAGAREIAAMPELFGRCPSFGREGMSPPGHYIMYVPDIGDNAKRHQFNPAGDFIDVRAGKCMTVFPPSEHEAKIVWTRGEMPREIPSMKWKDLSERAWLVAFLATCLKFYTGKGEHDEYVLAVAGALAHRGIEPDLGQRLIHGLCTAADDTHEIHVREAKALTSWNKVQAGEKVKGLTFLCENHFEEAFAKKLKTYLQPEAERVKIDIKAIWVDDPNVSAFTDAVVARLMELEPHLVFQRAGDLVRLRTVETLERSHKDAVRVHPGTKELIEVKEPWLDHRVTKMGMKFYGLNSKGKTKDKPPANLGKRIIEVKDNLPFHPIIGISTTPILSCSKPGYDLASKLYLAFEEGLFPKGESHPSKAMAEVALKRILHPFRLFPFVDGGLKSASAAVTASAMICGVIRAEMETCPMHGGNAPIAGAGKTKWAQMISAVVTGQAATNIISYNPKESEFQKCLFSLFLRGATNIVIDNVNSPLYGSFLNMALTSPIVTDRILGVSESPPVSARALILVTGNNLSANEEIQRRMVTATIDPDTEYPAERKFPFEPVAEVLANRPQMVVDCLTILRAYIAAKRPCDPVDLGMFEDWTVVRGALMWLEMPDPLLTQHTGLVSDPSKDARRDVLAALYDWRKGEAFTIAEIGKFNDGDSVRQAFEGALRNGWSVSGAGKLLGKYAGHWTGDLCLRRGAKVHQSTTWYVETRDDKAAKAALIVPEKHEFGDAYARAEALNTSGRMGG